LFYTLREDPIETVIKNNPENLEDLCRQAGELEPRLAEFEDAVLGIESLQHGPQFLREQLSAAKVFRRAGDTRREQICYLKAGLAFQLLESQVLTPQ
jgi:hypothetical protein